MTQETEKNFSKFAGKNEHPPRWCITFGPLFLLYFFIIVEHYKYNHFFDSFHEKNLLLWYYIRR